MSYKKQNNKNNETLSFIELEMGKMPPQAVELEEAVLAAFMLERECLFEYLNKVHEGSFYKTANQTIFRTIKVLFEKGSDVDILTVTNHLKIQSELEEVGGAYYISQLTSKMASSANIGTHIAIINDCAVQRMTISLCSSGITMAYQNPNPPEIMQFLDSGLSDINRLMLGRSIKNDGPVIIERIYQENISTDKPVVNGVPTGFTEITDCTFGWQNSDLILLAMRASMGKTALGLHFCKAAAKAAIPCAFVSLEMSAEAIYNRLLSSEGEVSYQAVRNIKAVPLTTNQFERYKDAKDWLVRAPIHVLDESGLSITELGFLAREYVREFKVKMLVIDYLQLLLPSKECGTREQEVSNISSGLKALAKQLKIPIIALSQIGREVEKRPDKRPMLSDLRESGSLEQDADLVMMGYRPSYYYSLKSDKDYCKDLGDEDEYNQIMEWMLVKNRNGPLDRGLIYFNEQTNGFYNKYKQQELPF